jgi:hypothetical protein
MEALGHKLLDLNGARALKGDVGKLIVFDLDILVLADGIAFDLLFGRHFLAGDRIHHLPLQAVAGGAVERVEADFFGGGCCGVDGDGSTHQAELEVALPVRTRRHSLYSQLDTPTKSGGMERAGTQVVRRWRR